MLSYSQELLEAVLYAPLVDGEESGSDLVDGFGQAVDVVAVACRGQQTHTDGGATHNDVNVYIENRLTSAWIPDGRDLDETFQIRESGTSSRGNTDSLSVVFMAAIICVRVMHK